jgi:hypothetical protein
MAGFADNKSALECFAEGEQDEADKLASEKRSEV